MGLDSKHGNRFMACMNRAVESRIREIRGLRVILDRDLAEVYGVSTKRLNEQFRRNAKKFPVDFAFLLTRQEVTNLKSQIATSSLEHGGRRKLPRAFTEHGSMMAAETISILTKPASLCQECDHDGIGPRRSVPVHSHVAARTVEDRILEIRGERVMIDRDLAEVYGVPTKRLNEQVKRNPKRFPTDFAFRLTKEETVEVVANCDHLRNLKFSRVLPVAFTEHGALEASNVLNSDRAVEMSLFVIRAFVKMRDMLAGRGEFARRLEEVERRLLRHDASLQEIYREIKALRQEAEKPARRAIGFGAESGGA